MDMLAGGSIQIIIWIKPYAHFKETSPRLSLSALVRAVIPLLLIELLWSLWRKAKGIINAAFTYQNTEAERVKMKALLGGHWLKWQQSVVESQSFSQGNGSFVSELVTAESAQQRKPVIFRRIKKRTQFSAGLKKKKKCYYLRKGPISRQHKLHSALMVPAHSVYPNKLKC